MSMDIQNEIEQLHLSFLDIRADDHDRKVDNVKSRIYLMKQLIASRPESGGRGSEPKSKPQIRTQDTRSEMDDLRSKLVGKPSKGFPTKSLPFNLMETVESAPVGTINESEETEIQSTPPTPINGTSKFVFKMFFEGIPQTKSLFTLFLEFPILCAV